MARIFAVPIVALAAVAVVGSVAARPPGPSAATNRQVAAAAPASPGASASASVVEVADLEDQVLDAINTTRRRHGLGVLRLNARLSSAARAHSRSMAEHGFFDHTSYDGSAFWRRLESVYAPVKGRSWEVGENLAWASPTMGADLALKMWMQSPPHRKNLLAPGWREIGLGGVHALAAPGDYDGLDVTILTADFGAR